MCLFIQIQAVGITTERWFVAEPQQWQETEATANPPDLDQLMTKRIWYVKRKVGYAYLFS